MIGDYSLQLWDVSQLAAVASLLDMPEQAVQELWLDCDVNPFIDCWLAILPDGNLCGIMYLWQRAPQTMGIVLHVPSMYWGWGIRTALCQLAEEQTRNASFASSLAVDLDLTDRALLTFFVDRGYQFSSGGAWRMEYQLSQSPPLPQWPSAVGVRTFCPREDTVLLRTALREIWPGFLFPEKDTDPSLIFLVWQDDQFVGAALCDGRQDEGSGFIDQLFIRPPWRRQGIARALLLHTFNVFFQRGYLSVQLEGSSENHNAHKLYTQIGMHELWHINTYHKKLRA
ncbi:GNAT family N-acetyltransferase [Tengunoibacter tsumagoiensis]|uniref:N-acetyltransferase domain-containing protein n=1 Tax=Tengunoibacter tsumagoiensis TaxID=2014871 RepID=A0A402A616_9CHLR|nr:GNAT family N-acetyltransferase [Tengunoibacter tsumagoiensis]GCE14431.1 hypothetical protein KTT_42900 [Tengunoibacter tsumagoiensis]